MQRLLLLLAVALAFSFTAFAQGTGASSTTTTTTTTKSSKSEKTAAAGEKKTAAAKTSQLTGCLAKDPSGKGYALTNARYKKGIAIQSDQDLSAHVGHKVMLTGTWQGDKGAKLRTFTATKLKHIAATCTATATTEKPAPKASASPGDATTKK